MTKSLLLNMASLLSHWKWWCSILNDVSLPGVFDGDINGIMRIPRRWPLLSISWVNFGWKTLWYSHRSTINWQYPWMISYKPSPSLNHLGTNYILTSQLCFFHHSHKTTTGGPPVTTGPSLHRCIDQSIGPRWEDPDGSDPESEMLVDDIQRPRSVTSGLKTSVTWVFRWVFEMSRLRQTWQKKKT